VNYPLPICGAHGRTQPATCSCPVESRVRLQRAGIVRESPVPSFLPWLTHRPTFTLLPPETFS
jgi:hypothetical protein